MIKLFKQIKSKSTSTLKRENNLRKLAKKCLSAVVAGAMVLALIPGGSSTVSAATIPADVKKPSEGCVFVAMTGEYVGDASAALKEINKIRYEACKTGVKWNGRKLTLKDYVPMKWSAGLEKIARIRAAESSITMGHVRLNGKSVFDFTYPNNGWPTNEVIAWNWSESMIMGVRQWYEEKYDYVHNTPGAVVGHYTSMINPANRYVGIGCFINQKATYVNTTVAQFMGAGKQSEVVAKPTGKCSATVEVQKSQISSVRISGNIAANKTIDRAQKVALSLNAVMKTYGTTAYKITSSVKWTSSNPAVASVSSSGVVTGLKKGKTKITASIGTKSTSFTLNVSGKCRHLISEKIVSSATTKTDGKVLHECRLCGAKKYITVKSIKSVSLSAVSFKYDGKAKTPTVTVKDSAGSVIPAKYYTVIYPTARTNPGTYKVNIKFKDRYSGTVVKSFKIVK